MRAVRFGLIGGDKRMIRCAGALKRDGHSVCCCGFDKYPGNDMEQCPADRAAAECDMLILPVPCSRDGRTVFAPFSSQEIPAGPVIAAASAGKPVFCGMKDRLPLFGRCVYDYSEREEFAVENAVATAEGAIALAIDGSEITICSSRCLVAGYGRIGRVLSKRLQSMGADVTVSARKLSSQAYIRSEGMRAVGSPADAGQCDFVFNTVPALIFDRETLKRTAAGSLLTDLASMPGGVDRAAAEELGIKVIHALSLPGRTAPGSAGIIIKNAVYNIIREEVL